MSLSINKKFVNKGVISGAVTILGGIVAIVEALGGNTPSLVVAVISMLAGLITSRDSVQTREVISDLKSENVELVDILKDDKKSGGGTTGTLTHLKKVNTQ